MRGSASASGGAMLFGRRSEREVLDRLIDGARAGRSGVVVVRGEPGIGKTALLEHVVEAASDMEVVRVVGVESEMELAFAALHQLCAPIMDRLERLPGPQRDALETTFGLSEGPVPDRFLVGLAVLSLLAEAGEDRPLLCLVDDAHWLDRASAQTLAFAARRLLAESVVMIFAAREPGEELRGLPDLPLEGLGDADAHDLLAAVVRWPLDDRVREQVVAETRGNPLALTELTWGLTQSQLAGGFAFSGMLSLAGRIQESFRTRLEPLPPDTRRLLLAAAVEPGGDPALLWRAAKGLGIAAPRVEPAVDAGLLEVATRVRFRHPLVRSAVYRAASGNERREVHRALADATDAHTDPDTRAWHLAEATAGPDEHVASELERAAERAQRRGGLAAAAAFLQRATVLSAEPSLRTDRALAAAQTKVTAGALDGVEHLLAAAEAGPLSELQLARADLVRAQLAFVTSRGNDAPPLLVSAAKRLEAVAPDLARATYLDAFGAAMFAARMARPGGSLVEVARAARETPSQADGVADLFLDGYAASFSRGYAAGLPILRGALRAFQSGMPADQEVRGGPVGFVTAVHTWDEDASELIPDRWAGACRQIGALSDLPLALNCSALMLMLAGDMARAASLLDEVQAATEATGINFAPYGTMYTAAFRGSEAEALALIDANISQASLRGEGSLLSAAEWASAVLNNGLGRYQHALAAAERASENPFELIFTNWALSELIEAAVRTGMSEPAARAYQRLAEMTGAAGTDWALGIDARSRALITDGDDAESLYQEAIERLGRTRMAVELARARLLYGEWLRRERRRVDARNQLRRAYEAFTAAGLDAFTARTERELLATGEHVRKRVAETRDDLTSQEAQIARLAWEGLSNAEIGARLFISRRTVEYHLSKVFAKLSISSRHELERVLPLDRSAARG